MSDLEDGELSEGEIVDDEPVASTSPPRLTAPPPPPNLQGMMPPSSSSPLARNVVPSTANGARREFESTQRTKWNQPTQHDRSTNGYPADGRSKGPEEILHMHNRPPPPILVEKSDTDLRKRVHNQSPPHRSPTDIKRMRPAAPSSFSQPPPSFGQPPPNRAQAPNMGGPLGPFQPIRRRFLCKFFREGHCRDSENCTFSHSAADANRAPELCKWYADTFCRKGAHCQYLHAEWPCLQHHKAKCDRKPCKYSHEPLDAFTRPIVERFLAGEKEAAQRAAKAAAVQPLPPRPPRKVLLQLPLSQRGDMQICEFAKALQYQRLMFVEDALATQQAQALALQHQQQASLAAANNVTKALAPQTGLLPAPDACFTPIAPTARPGGLLATPALPQQDYRQETVTYRPPMNDVFVDRPIAQRGQRRRRDEEPPAVVDLPKPRVTDVKKESEEGPTFNLQEMLARIRAQVPVASKSETPEKKEIVDDSPASPPPVANGGGNRSRAIPAAKVIRWRLREVHVEHAPNTNIAQSLLDSALTDLRLRSDPRIKKALSAQFNATTNALTTALPQQQQQLQQQQSRVASEDPAGRHGARDPRLARRQAQQQAAAAEAKPPPPKGGWMPSFSSDSTLPQMGNSSPPQPVPFAAAQHADPRLARRQRTMPPTDPRSKPVSLRD